MDPVPSLPLAAARAALSALLRSWQQLPEVLRLCPGGGVRRMEARVDGLDLLLTSYEPATLTQALLTRPDLASAHSVGDRVLGQTRDGLPVRIRIVAESSASFAAAWIAATGPPEHVAALEQRAAQRGLSLTADGLMGSDGPRGLAGEAELYEALGLSFIPPECRSLPLDRAPAPDLVAIQDVRGLFLTRSLVDGGCLAPPAWLQAAGQEGYEWLVLGESWPLGDPAPALDRLLELRGLASSSAVRPLIAGLVSADLAHRVDRAPKLCDAYDLLVLEARQGGAAALWPDMGAVQALLAHPRLRVIAHPGLAVPWAQDPEVWDLMLECAQRYAVAVEVSAAPQAAVLGPRWHAQAQERGLRAVAGARLGKLEDLDEAVCALGLLRAQGWVREAVLSTQHTRSLLHALGQGGQNP